MQRVTGLDYELLNVLLQDSVVEFFLPFLAAAAVAYLCGCFNGAVIVSKYILRNDVRNHGSGNAGLTNFLRTFGGPLTAVVILTDVLKAVAALWVGMQIFGACFTAESLITIPYFTILKKMPKKHLRWL